ncbi:hypothetical protein D3C81_07100 [compost metagenome]
MSVGIKFNTAKKIDFEVRSLRDSRYYKVLNFLRLHDNMAFKSKTTLYCAIGLSDKEFHCNWGKVIGELVSLAVKEEYVKLLTTAEVRKENLPIYVENYD